MEQNKIKLSDLMTAAQALKILEYCESLEKRVENLENEIQALRYEQTWGDIERETKRFIIERENNYEI